MTDPLDGGVERLFTLLADRYRLIGELGRGGMARVYLAEDIRHTRSVAIKVMRPEIASPGNSARFLREIDVAARLHHPHIVPLFDSGVAEGQLFYVMAYEPGETLRDRLLREKQLPVDEALRIAREVTDALAHAHEHGVIHRDIKPANILLSNGHALLADFGIARAVTATTDQVSTTGIAVGTPAYMSPEQGLADRDLDGRSDIYSLGCVLWEMLVGAPPFSGPSPQAILAAHRGVELPSARVFRPGIPVAVEQLVSRSLAKSPADRFRTAAELRDALTRLEIAVSSDELRVLDAPPMIGRTNRLTSSRRVRQAALGVAALIVVLGLGMFWPFGGVQAHPHRIAIFPLEQRLGLAAAGQDDIGLSASRLIGYRLSSAPNMQFVDAADYLTGMEQTGVSAVSFDRKRALSRTLGADYFIDGTVDPVEGGNVAVVLRLRGVTDRTDVSAGADGEGSDVPRLALAALRKLLPAFLEPDRRVDHIALEQRDPVAILNFIDAERAYRHSRFQAALQKYDEAIQRDSLFAVAALKGAQAASWINRNADANRLAATAVRHVGQLPPRYADYARALQHFLRGEGNEALRLARPLVVEDAHWTDAWMLLGESYFHLAPTIVRPDSIELLADSAFRMAGRADSAFTPAMRHLLDLSLRHGNVARADSIVPLLKPSLPDSEATWLDAIVECVRRGSGGIDARQLQGAGAAGGWHWGETLVFHPQRGECARSALRHTLSTQGAPRNALWGALVGINASLSAAGRHDEATSLVNSPAVASIGGWALLFVNAAGGAPPSEFAHRRADSLGTDFARLPSAYLWLLTSWYSLQEDSAALRRIAGVLGTRRDSTHSHLDSLSAAVASAHLAVARGDTTAAMEQLARLTPRASYSDLMWQPWEAYAGERMLLARLHEARGEYDDALRVATLLDAPVPMVNLVHLRASLELRERVARRLGNHGTADDLRARLNAWSADRAR